MKKIIPFCASLALLLGVSGGANAALFPTSTFSTDLGTVTGTTPFGNVFDTDDGIANPFTFSDVFEYTPVAGTTTSIAVATTFQVVVRNITGFVGRLYTGEFGGSEVISQALFDAAPGSSFFALTVATACVASGLTCTINMTAPTVGGVQHFMHFVGTADGSGDQDNVFGDYAGTITVPLPPAVVLFLSALAGLVGFSRIRRRKAVTT